MPKKKPQVETLDTEAIKVAKALGGKIDALTLLHAHVEETGGEHRPQQDEMAEAVTQALKGTDTLLVQAGTGTGKSLAYLFPLAAANMNAVIATATNQLSEQLIRHDLPQVQATLAETGQDLSFALLKGRANYVCKARIAELDNLNAEAERHGGAPDDEEDRLFEIDEPVLTATAAKKKQAKADSSALSEVMAWARTTRNGDRSEAPGVPDRIWAQVSTTTADCPGATNCPFGEQCFTESARQIARASKIVVTNHALLAQDIKAGLETESGTTGSSVFGQRAAFIVDEAHDFPGALTSALSSEVDQRSLAKFLGKAAKYINETSKDNDGEPATIKAIRLDLEALSYAFDELPPGPLDKLPAGVTDLLTALTTRMMTLNSLLTEAERDANRGDKAKRAAAISTLAQQANAYAVTLNGARSVAEGNVRWLDRDRRDNTPILRTAPIHVGEALTETLAGRSLIATSATLTLGGDFGPILRTFGKEPNEVTTLDVGSPFDYPKQGMLYVPAAPFPEPVGRERTEHTAAVLDDLTELVRAAGGRTLALFTTTAGAQRAADHLRREFPGLTVHAAGDAPADVLVQEFTHEETSVLCATMGLWQGVSIDGASCSLVVIDKVAFAPVDDVLTAARRKYVDNQRRDGFTEVIVAQAATSLAQGAGRLIRTKSDKGVVAILDPRLRTKGYGRLLLASLPDFNMYADRDQVTGALTRLTGGLHPDALKAAPGRRKTTSAYPARKRSAPRRASTTKAISKKNLRPKRID